VLLVDDNDELRSLLLSRLAGFGYEAVGAVDGIDALAELARHHQDILITDIVMPRLDGIGLVERVRANPATAQLPIIVMTGWFGDDEEERHLPVGADAVLRKPLRSSELMELLARLVNRPGNEDQGERGVLVSTSMQLLQLLEQSGTVEVRSAGGEGVLRLVEGELVGAAVGELRGEAAARELFSWSRAEIKLRQIDEWGADEQIYVPLIELLTPSKVPIPPTAIATDLAAPTNPADSGQVVDVLTQSDPSTPSTSSQDPAPFHRSDRTDPSGWHRLVERDGTTLLVTLPTARPPAQANRDAGSSALVDQAIGIPGVIAVALIDEHLGTVLRESESIDADIARLAGSLCQFVGAKCALLKSLGQTDALECLTISLPDRVLVFRPLERERITYLVLVLDRARANVELALRELDEIEARLRDDSRTELCMTAG
jgi:CheY-like chemotaxis protein